MHQIWDDRYPFSRDLILEQPTAPQLQLLLEISHLPVYYRTLFWGDQHWDCCPWAAVTLLLQYLSQHCHRSYRDGPSDFWWWSPYWTANSCSLDPSYIFYKIHCNLSFYFCHSHTFWIYSCLISWLRLPSTLCSRGRSCSWGTLE